MVKPTIVAGVNALGRGQDREALGMFLTTIAQTMGPEALQQFINAEEVVKRLAAAQGIDVLNLVRSMQEVQGEQQAMQQQQLALEQSKIATSDPMNDPSKNPQLAEELSGRNEGVPPEAGPA